MTDMMKTMSIIDEIAEAINQSLGPDWSPHDGAFHVMQWLTDNGLEIVAAPVRGTECPTSLDGWHHVDTSMENGPDNCFHCAKPMPKPGSNEWLMRSPQFHPSDLA